jgi:hypothetical protein
LGNFKAWCKTRGCEWDADSLCCIKHTGLCARQLVHYLPGRPIFSLQSH